MGCDAQFKLIILIFLFWFGVLPAILKGLENISVPNNFETRPSPKNNTLSFGLYTFIDLYGMSAVLKAGGYLILDDLQLHSVKEMAKFMRTEEDGNWVQDLDLESMPHHTTLQGTHWIFDDSVLMIKTLEGFMVATKGDFIIRGIKGEYYPCKPDIFHLTYDEEYETNSVN